MKVEELHESLSPQEKQAVAAIVSTGYMAIEHEHLSAIIPEMALDSLVRRGILDDDTSPSGKPVYVLRRDMFDYLTDLTRQIRERTEETARHSRRIAQEEGLQ